MGSESDSSNGKSLHVSGPSRVIMQPCNMAVLSQDWPHRFVDVWEHLHESITRV